MQTDRPSRTSRFTTGPALVFYLAAAQLLLHLATASRYGYFRDELYCLACSAHLDWGYVDQPPLIAAFAWLVRHTLGESLLALRLLPALASAALVWLTGALARELGGGRRAQALAALGAACAGVYLVQGYLFTMNAFEPLFWMGCAYVVIRIIQTGNQRLWVWFGVLAGLGLENKYSMAVFGFAIVAGLLLTPQRRLLAGKWIWIGGAVALLLFLPNLLWNISHHWPFLELMRNLRASGRDLQVGAGEFLARQILLLNPASFPLWLAGVLYLLLAAAARPFRALGWAFVVLLGTFFILHGKDYYSTPVYPMALAGGGVAFEKVRRLRRGGAALAVLLPLFTILLLPVTAPVLTVEDYLRYQTRLPFPVPRTEKGHLKADLPQHYADQFGWEEMTAKVARIYDRLAPEERVQTGIIGNNYGQSAAIDFFGRKYGLPQSIGVHQNYFLWGPRGYTGEILIVLGDRPESLGPKCREVQVAAEGHHPYNPLEDDPILVCRGLKRDLREIWPQLKKWR